MTGYAIAPFTRRPLQTSCPRRWTARTILGTVSSSSHYPDVCPNFPKSNPCAAESHPAWCVRESTPWIFDVQICAGRFPSFRRSTHRPDGDCARPPCKVPAGIVVIRRDSADPPRDVRLVSGDPRTAGSTVQRRATRPNPHDHVVFHMSSGRAVVFNDPRRFGIMELIPAGKLQRHPVLSKLGPEPLSGEFDGAVLAQAFHRKKTSLKAALMDQRVVAGLGNIYASEALHIAGLSPRRRASTLATASGAPRDRAHDLASAIKGVLEKAIARQSQPAYRDDRFLVYERQDEPCSKSGCAGYHSQACAVRTLDVLLPRVSAVNRVKAHSVGEVINRSRYQPGPRRPRRLEA